jgi:hypothetical protein
MDARILEQFRAMVGLGLTTETSQLYTYGSRDRSVGRFDSRTVTPNRCSRNNR